MKLLKYKILNKLFGTDLKRKTLEEVTISDLKSLGVTTIGVDADNTTSFDGTIEPLPYSVGFKYYFRGIKLAK